MIARVLMAASAAVVFILGAMHLVLTFIGPKLTPRDPSLRERMSEISPVLTRRTTMWKAWVGFNASHSLGAILFGLIYGYLALAHGPFLFASPFLVTVGLAMLASLVLLGWRYWFSVPFRSLVVALLLYLASIVIAHTSGSL